VPRRLYWRVRQSTVHARYGLFQHSRSRIWVVISHLVRLDVLGDNFRIELAVPAVVALELHSRGDIEQDFEQVNSGFHACARVRFSREVRVAALGTNFPITGSGRRLYQERSTHEFRMSGMMTLALVVVVRASVSVVSR